MVGRLGSGTLSDVSRCPYCSVANPNLGEIWVSEEPVPRSTPGPTYMWGLYRCASCGGVVLARGMPNNHNNNVQVEVLLPEPKRAHEDIPEPARTFLQQALETLHAPDAAAVMAGSAVDAMLKDLGYTDGSVYARIETAVAQHKLTEGMGDWAHEVRLGSNRPRHADAEKPHVSSQEANQSVEFAEALGFFLFVLTKRIERGTAAAKAAPAAPQVSNAPAPITPIN